MEIVLEPSISHCIQTLAKKEYDYVMNQLLEIGLEKPELGERLEVLKRFLESTDFNKLRSEYEPYIIEGKRVTFTLYPEKDTTEYRMEII